jgi:ATP-binding cassette subfamily F protein 3
VVINRGERWGVIGPNGAGKTTLVRAILDELPLSAGQTKMGFNVVTGYYSQMPPGENDEWRVYEYLQAIIRRELPDKPLSEQAARNLAGTFLFSGEDQEKQLRVMSGGERSRARLAGLLASAKNLLVLDEPTNHLDIPSAERLEEALAPSEEGGTYDGTLILISHDRALIDATCDHLLVLDGQGNATAFLGNYTDWQRKQREQAGKPAAGWGAGSKQRGGGSKGTTKAGGAGGVGGAGGSGGKPPERPAAKPASASPAPTVASSSSSGSTSSGTTAATAGPKPAKKGGKFSWMPVDRLEKEIQKLTEQVRTIDDELAKEEVYRDAKKFKGLMADREKQAAELAGYEEEWLRRAEG